MEDFIRRVELNVYLPFSADNWRGQISLSDDIGDASRSPASALPFN